MVQQGCPRGTSPPTRLGFHPVRLTQYQQDSWPAARQRRKPGHQSVEKLPHRQDATSPGPHHARFEAANPKGDSAMEGPKNRISRRGMLKRLGAGAAVAWSAPIISSLRTPAFAQYALCRGETFECGGPFTECGGTPCGEGPCVCDVDLEGNEFCWDNYRCASSHACSSNSDCADLGATWRCVTSCCNFIPPEHTPGSCAPPCGTCEPNPLRAQRGAMAVQV
jgi:hypothetical protein